MNSVVQRLDDQAGFVFFSVQRVAVAFLDIKYKFHGCSVSMPGNYVPTIIKCLVTLLDLSSM